MPPPQQALAARAGGRCGRAGGPVCGFRPPAVLLLFFLILAPLAVRGSIRAPISSGMLIFTRTFVRFSGCGMHMGVGIRFLLRICFLLFPARRSGPVNLHLWCIYSCGRTYETDSFISESVPWLIIYCIFLDPESSLTTHRCPFYRVSERILVHTQDADAKLRGLNNGL